MNTTTVNQTDCPEVKVPVPLFFTIGVVSLAENLLVVVSVILNRNLHSPMFCFICSLAAFNTMASLTKTWETVMIVLANVGQLEKKGSSEMSLDDVMDSLLCMSFVGSISSFLAIAVDRYLHHDLPCSAIPQHHDYAAHKGYLGVIWITCGVSAVLMVTFSHSKFIMISFVVFFVVSLAIICFLYFYMFMLARIHARKIAVLPSSSGGKFGRQRWRGGSMKGALTLTILFGVFVVCWTPFFLHLILLMVCPMNPYCECYRSLFQLHVVLMMSHAAIDPAIYAFRSVELRHTFRKMLLCSDWKQRS
ncbi:hypothetical protein F7725_019093 [Dissostichus mawsoni]|uniref:Adrenocorticotropic hormone receptor n=1 Tax=Dissostichus mawsoni TaxID=36200 RepID=A0A7J5XTD6_DISMA|nr:hypothetical protein F7725_019093 [Dissostichus mawsoni]